MSILFEYGEKAIVANRALLEPMLRSIWKERRALDTDEEIPEEVGKNYQPFLQFDGDQVRANNYVGFIQDGDDVIEIYPKVFNRVPGIKERTGLMLHHIFYWFDYCRKWRFPTTKSSLDTYDNISFPELLIKLFASQFHDAISTHPFINYQHVEEALQTPRGSINFSRYISKSLVYGNYQNVECDYEPFLFDNKVNRVIKYCARMLMNQTKLAENVRVLQEVLFILDEVEDKPCSIYDVNSIVLNPFYDDYIQVMDSCKLIVNQQLYSNTSYDLSQWCLLFPMEYIFEDFFAGFLEDKFSSHWEVEYQKSNLNLSNNPQAFRMQHDIFLTAKDGSNRKIIVDTKYKVRDIGYKSDSKKGISQNDLYQMVSYAYKRGCTDVLLVYPNISDEINPPDHFVITSGFNEADKINVTAIEIPFWSSEGTNGLEDKLFEAIKTNLDRYLLPIS